MASTSTGEMFTHAQYEAMTQQQRSDLDIIPITVKEQSKLEPMSLEERKAWLKEHRSQKPSRRQLNKRERQNKKAARP